MFPFTSIATNSYACFSQLEQAAEEAAQRDGFVIIKKRTDYAADRSIIKGTYRCYKSGASTSQIRRGTAKTDCPFIIHFRRQAATGVYFFTPNYEFTHNNELDHTSTVMAPQARRFTPSQADLIDSPRASEVPIS